ncbi:predicted protein [Chaetomium globosum CBS 148.51]|uniref:LysM domain-containing protein n=1 Tax=Chaetomium globosum (strain ATCC 6205 / CBS 148.51 / DSM 1962 / NBRC 6347 / NRRL 1970) TaxID=306901 RepID=Q2H4Q8_CHAGB|nr:uncharacterized protein CHGG_06357 [Chaetomium globosum CBS 148.51]EAQ89738.1 predicted protein [Chaetomium globosum CBS 148.51]
MVHLTNSILAVVLGLSTLSAAARHSTDSEKTHKPSSFGYFEDCKAYTGSDPNPAPIITDEDGFPRYLVKRDIPQANCNHPTKEYEFRNGRLVFVGYKYPSRGARCGRLPKYRYCLWHTMFGDKKAMAGTRNCLPHVVEPNPRSISTCNCWVEIIHRGGAGTRTCDAIAKGVGATVEQIKEWNPWVGDDCDSGLYAGMGSWDPRAVCAGVKGFVPPGGADL